MLWVRAGDHLNQTRPSASRRLATFMARQNHNGPQNEYVRRRMHLDGVRMNRGDKEDHWRDRSARLIYTSACANGYVGCF